MLKYESPNLELAYGIGMVCFTVLLGGPSLFSRLIPREWGKIAEAKRAEFSNRLVALCVCVGMSVLAGWYWKDNSHLATAGLPEDLSLTPLQQLGVEIMIGYILYDLVICLFVESEVTILFFVHHLSGLLSHYLVLCYGDGLGAMYTMAVYLAEGSTPFYHIAWFIHELRSLDDPCASRWQQGTWNFLFTACSGLLLLFFFILRVVLSPLIVYHAYTWGLTYWTAEISMDIGRTHVGILVLFMLINFYWFYNLLAAAFRVFLSGDTPSDDKKKE